MCADSTSEVMFWGFSALFLELPLCAKRYRQITWLNTISLLNLTKFFPHATKCTLLLCTTAHSVFCCYESYRNSIESFSYTQEIAGNSYFLLFPLYVWKESELFYWSQLCNVGPDLRLAGPLCVSCNSYLAFQSHTCMDRHRLDIFYLHRKWILKFWIT